MPFATAEINAATAAALCFVAWSFPKSLQLFAALTFGSGSCS
jgi:hypothetical protein